MELDAVKVGAGTEYLSIFLSNVLVAYKRGLDQHERRCIQNFPSLIHVKRKNKHRLREIFLVLE